MRRVIELFRSLANRTKAIDETAFDWSTKKTADDSWELTIHQGLEPYFRIATLTDPESVNLIEERATLVCDVMNASTDMAEMAANSAENQQLAQDLLDGITKYFDALDLARGLTAKSGLSTDANQRALIAASKAEDELRALIIGSGGSAA